MKHLKMLGLAMVAVAALMAFAGPVSAAPVLTSPTGVDYTGHLEATATGSLLLQASVFNETCTESIVTGDVTTNNTTHASGPITTLHFSNCGSANIKVLQNGSLTIDPTGTVTGSGSQVTVETIGVSCVYGTTTGTDLGNLTPSKKHGETAVMHVNANLPRISGSFLCANPAKWQGTYTVTKPDELFLK